MLAPFGLVTLALAVAADMGMSLLVTSTRCDCSGAPERDAATGPVGPVDRGTEDCCSNE
jgi:hypothetical protein